MRLVSGLVVLLGLAVGHQALLAAPPDREIPIPPARSPAESLKAIQVRPGFTVELVASEPLVADPIAFDWGADATLWVVEMGDYPMGTDGKGKPGGRVLTLKDDDGDGRYDRATTFLDGLGFPTGLLPWRNGLIVACAPRSSTPRTPTTTVGPIDARSCSPGSARGTSSTGSTGSSSASTAGCTAPMATAGA